MSVELSITFAATDGSLPESIRIEWSDSAGQPSVGQLTGIITELARLPERRQTVSAVAEPAAIPPGFVAGADMLYGDLAGVRTGSMVEILVHAGEETGAPSWAQFQAMVVEKIAKGDRMVYAAKETGRGHIWKRAPEEVTEL